MSSYEILEGGIRRQSINAPREGTHTASNVCSQYEQCKCWYIFTSINYLWSLKLRFI